MPLVRGRMSLCMTTGAEGAFSDQLYTADLAQNYLSVHTVLGIALTVVRERGLHATGRMLQE